MEITKIDLSLESTMLAPLRTLRSKSSSWENMPGKALPLKARETLAKIYECLIGEGFEDETFLLIAFNEQGSMKRYYPPSVYAPDEEADCNLQIRWGNSFIKLDFDGQNFKVQKAHPTLTCSFSFAKSKIGSYEEPCLVATIMDKIAKTVNIISFPLRFADWKAKLEPDALNTMLIMGEIASLQALLQQPKAKKIADGESVNSIVYDCKSLPEWEPCEFVKAKQIARKAGGITYILTNTNGEQFWSPNGAVSLLQAGALCTEENPFVITRFANGERNKYEYDSSFPKGSEVLDLSWLK